MEMEGLDDIYKLHRFKPSPEEAVTYFLPHLLAGSSLPHGADRLIYHADVYAREPRDLAAEYVPVPTAVAAGDRFFFTTCKGTNGRFKRSAGGGTWATQKTENVYDSEAKVGEVKHLSFKKGKDKASTGWVMEEYRCLLPEAVVPGVGEKVLCKIHLAPTAPAAARQESAAYKLRQVPALPAHPPQPEPVTVTASAHLQKRPAPAGAAAADPSSCKKMRIAARVPEPEEEFESEDCLTWPAAPATEVPAAAELEADADTGRLSCSWEEIFGEPQEEQTHPVEAGNNIEQLGIDQQAEPFEAFWNQIDWEAVIAKSCNYNAAAAADLHAPSFAAVN